MLYGTQNGEWRKKNDINCRKVRVWKFSHESVGFLRDFYLENVINLSVLNLVILFTIKISLVLNLMQKRLKLMIFLKSITDF